jgi:PAS domain S-box-containing protein
LKKPPYENLKAFLAVVFFTTAATGIRALVSPILGFRSPLLFHVFAVALATQISGLAAGLATTGLSLVLIDYFFIPPAYSLVPSNPADGLDLLLFLCVGILLSIFGGWRKRAEDELKNAYERMALKHEVARMGTFEWFVPENRVEWSEEMEKIYGIESATHVHTVEEWKAYVHPEDRDAAVKALEETVRKKLPTFDQTYRIVRPDGEVRWVHTRRKYQYDSDGNPVYVMGINMDVTELKEGEMAQEILGGMVQVCSACRRLHDAENESWYSMEGYLRRHTTARFSHGMCPDCSKQWYEAEAN